MPLKINGHSFSWSALTATVGVIFWLSGLSWQVTANGDEIQKQSETKERLVRLEEQRETVADDITEIKTTLNTTQEAVIANKLTLARILVIVERND
ncbi:hypothetical protein LCGC14_2463210 [marine sediment metagenome]|uniref:Uncharacterized protein n=1 Tax=marine sediment metagenome TaxID=412755 RepID=A0A0F9BCL2_9ZZZZ